MVDSWNTKKLLIHDPQNNNSDATKFEPLDYFTSWHRHRSN